MSKIFHLFCLRLLPCRAGAHVRTVCETQRAVLFPCSVCLQLSHKRRQVRVRDPVLFMLPRSPPVRGRRRLTTIQNKFYLNGLAPLVHPGITEYFSAQEAEMAV